MVRLASPAHARDIAALLAELGTPRTRAEIQQAMAVPGAVWHVAEAGDGSLIGAQWIEPWPEARHVAEIATFTADGPGRIAVGSALFEATEETARHMGYRRLIARITAENSGALIYYQSRGFEALSGDTAAPAPSILVRDLR